MRFLGLPEKSTVEEEKNPHNEKPVFRVFFLVW
jgi:hypothetical protein